MGGPGADQDRTLLLWLGGAVLLIIVLVSIFAPVTGNDERPSTDNPAPGGVKAAFLMLQSMGGEVQRWDHSLDDLRALDAAHTTVVLADPSYAGMGQERYQAEVKGFLARGGRLLTTGVKGALLLPGGEVKAARRIGSLCYTQPEGPGALAQAGTVEMQEAVRWGDESPKVFIEQRCGPDAVVVRLPVGAGEATWWSSASPMTNAELRRDADLRLLLASLGTGRTVLFDEAIETERSPWTAARGLPLWWMLGQAGLIFGLLVFSFSRRHGPVRLPVALPRSSPVEFAFSMGDLYERAGATASATGAARRRLEQVLVRDGRLAQGTVERGPEAVVTELESRFGGGWASVGDHLREAAVAQDVQMKAGSALALVRALGEDARRVQHAAGTGPRGTARSKAEQERPRVG